MLCLRYNIRMSQEQEFPQPPEGNGDSTIPVNLNPELFAYVKVNLRPIYEAQLADATKEDSYNALKDFHTSRLGRLGDQFGRFQEPADVPENPALDLSKQDVAFINDSLAPSYEASAVEMMAHKGKMEALKMAFEKAQKAQKSEGNNNPGILDKLRSKFKS